MVRRLNIKKYQADKGHINLTDVRALTSSTTAQAKAIAERLVHQVLLVPLADDAFELAPVMKERYGHADTDSGVESGPESGPESIHSRVLVALGNRELSKSELSQAIGQKSVSGKLNQRIREMLADGLIERTIPGKPTSSRQKYRLTDKGQQWLAAQTGKDKQ